MVNGKFVVCSADDIRSVQEYGVKRVIIPWAAASQGSGVFLPELEAMLAQAHDGGMQVDLAADILPDDSQLDALMDEFRRTDLLRPGRIQGVRLQNIGLARVIRQAYPHLKVIFDVRSGGNHPAYYTWLQRMGLDGAVLSRELSLESLPDFFRSAGAPFSFELRVFGAIAFFSSRRALLDMAVGQTCLLEEPSRPGQRFLLERGNDSVLHHSRYLDLRGHLGRLQSWPLTLVLDYRHVCTCREMLAYWFDGREFTALHGLAPMADPQLPREESRPPSDAQEPVARLLDVKRSRYLVAEVFAGLADGEELLCQSPEGKCFSLRWQPRKTWSGSPGSSLALLPWVKGAAVGAVLMRKDVDG